MADPEDDLRDPNVRHALEWLRVATVVVLLLLLCLVVIERREGGFEYAVMLIGAIGTLLGISTLERLLGRK